MLPSRPDKRPVDALAARFWQDAAPEEVKRPAAGDTERCADCLPTDACEVLTTSICRTRVVLEQDTGVVVGRRGQPERCLEHTVDRSEVLERLDDADLDTVDGAAVRGCLQRH